MFVDVEINVNVAATVAVPSDAVLDSGLEKTVFVDLGNGVFEPRPVETGWRLGDRVQITRGLEPGDHIVVSGNFLIDSESRLQRAAMPTPAAGLKRAAAEKATSEKDPVCGMDVAPNPLGAIKAWHAGKAYIFCSERCKKGFEANPGKVRLEKDGCSGRPPSAGAGIMCGTIRFPRTIGS